MPLPWSRVDQIGFAAGMDEEQLDDFHHYVSVMDKALREYYSEPANTSGTK